MEPMFGANSSGRNHGRGRALRRTIQRCHCAFRIRQYAALISVCAQ